MAKTFSGSGFTDIGMTALVVDNDSMALRAFSDMLAGGGIDCITASDCKAALNTLSRSHVDIIFADYHAPDMGAVTLYREVRARRLPTPFVILDARGSIDSAVRCMKLGVSDYIQKPCDLKRVMDTVRSAIHCKSHPAGADALAIDRLSQREKEVAAHVLDGLSNMEIAERLYVSERTVRTHMTSILRKTGLKSKLQLLASSFARFKRSSP